MNVNDRMSVSCHTPVTLRHKWRQQWTRLDRKKILCSPLESNRIRVVYRDLRRGGGELITVAGERLEATKTLTVRKDGTELVRYRVSLGVAKIMVAVGPAKGFDHQAMENIPVLLSYPVSTGQGVLLTLLVIALILAAVGWVGEKALPLIRRSKRPTKGP